MYYLQVQTVILLYGISHIQGFFHVTYEDFLLKNKQYFNFNKSILRSHPENWFEQPVDHFNVSDLRIWKQKYYKMITNWRPEGPILLYINGEDALTLHKLAMTYLEDYDPFIAQITKETGAAVFMLEHRYYGSSQPLDPSTTENLAFLTSRQALADAAHFLTTIKESPEFKNSKVMVVGGSYAGNLAAWMKVLYPQMIDAVLASSAPVLAKIDYSEFMETVTDTFRKYGSQECVNKITDRFNTFRELLQSSEGIEKLKKENNICQYVDMTVPENQQMFFNDELNSFVEEAQYGTPNSIISKCQDFKLFKLGRRFSVSWDDNNCYDPDFNHWINSINRTSNNLWPWIYQTCTEFGYFQTCSTNKQMFGNAIPIDFYYKTCKMLYGEEYNEERVAQGVMNTNRLYGGLTLNVTNVMFVNGDMDPWHRLSVLQDLSADVPAIYIEGSSHCHEFYPNPSDTENINEARKRIISLLKKWIGQA